MAHSCPTCGSLCHCGGDIDDLCFDDTKYARNCRCCDADEEDEFECWYDDAASVTDPPKEGAFNDPIDEKRRAQARREHR